MGGIEDPFGETQRRDICSGLKGPLAVEQGRQEASSEVSQGGKGEGCASGAGSQGSVPVLQTCLSGPGSSSLEWGRDGTCRVDCGEDEVGYFEGSTWDRTRTELVPCEHIEGIRV